MKTIYTPDTLFNTVDEVISCIRETVDESIHDSRLMRHHSRWAQMHQRDINQGISWN